MLLSVLQCLSVVKEYVNKCNIILKKKKKIKVKCYGQKHLVHNSNTKRLLRELKLKKIMSENWSAQIQDFDKLRTELMIVPLYIMLPCYSPIGLCTQKSQKHNAPMVMVTIVPWIYPF
jgi:uncharacterized protein YjhX (UPF0386 family)